MVQALTETTVQLSKKAILRANPQLSGQEINLLFCSFTYGENLANKIKEYIKRKKKMKDLDILGILEPIIKVFEKIGISYYIGGSLASSAYGIARSTMGIDLVADLSLDHVKILVKTLEQKYYIDEDMIKEAINRRSSFNVIHLETSIKIDIFVLQDSPYFKNAFFRKRAEILDEEGRLFFLPSPEDIILIKLDWYKSGSCTSERQWDDILGVLKVQKKNLDIKYLQHWAAELKVDKLLNKAFIESEITIPPNK